MPPTPNSEESILSRLPTSQASRPGLDERPSSERDTAGEPRGRRIPEVNPFDLTRLGLDLAGGNGRGWTMKPVERTPADDRERPRSATVLRKRTPSSHASPRRRQLRQRWLAGSEPLDRPYLIGCAPGDTATARYSVPGGTHLPRCRSARPVAPDAMRERAPMIAGVHFQLVG